MNKSHIAWLTAISLMAIPVTASFAQGTEGDNLNNLLGSSANDSAIKPAPSKSAAAPVVSTESADARAAILATGDKTTSGASGNDSATGSEPPKAHKAKATPVANVKDTNAAAPRKVASRLVEEIVVTAEKRQENIQDVPQSVTAFSAGKLEALGVHTVEDLPNITPGLTITNEAGFNVVFLRGVGTDAFLPGADASVPFYIDGVPLLSAQGSSDTLGQIERIEVLKGPQGTLFGTNSVGGAINIITPEPSQDFLGDVEVGYGNYNAKSVKGYVSAPITDKVAASLSLFANKQKNFYTNTAGPVIGIYSLGGRLKVRWDITDNLFNTFTASYQQVSNNASVIFENTRVAPFLAGVLPQDPKADRIVSHDALAGARNNSHLFADTVDWKLPMVEIKAIGSAQRLNVPFVGSDFDASAIPAVSAKSLVQRDNQYTGELQFLSTPGTPYSDVFSWVGGFFYIYTSGGLDPIEFTVAPNALQVLAGPLGSGLTDALNPLANLAGINLYDGIDIYNHGVIASSSLSGYFQGKIKIIDSLSLILGGRFQHTHKDLEGSRTTIPNADGSETVLLQDNVPTLYANQFSPRVGLQWYPFGPDIQIYASWARGYKTPTYNTVNLLGSLTHPINPVIQQKNDAYELGFKSQLFDRTLTLNAAAFYTREKDLLTGFLSVLTGGIVTYDNTPSARIRGLEGDALWSPLPEINPGLVLTASVSYLDTKYTDFPNGRGYDEATGLPFGPGFPVPPLPARDFTGNRIVRTPTLTYNAGISQTIPFKNGSLEVALDGNYNSGFFYLPQNSQIFATHAYYLLNAHATYTYQPWGLQVTLYGRNLTQTNYDASQFTSEFGRTELLNDPRTYGGSIKWSFGS